MSKKETVLITGASEGIGLDWVTLFAKDGHDLVLVARNKAKLESVQAEIIKEYGVAVDVFPKDLSYADAAITLYQEVKNAGIKVTILINNAGFGESGAFSEIPMSREMEMIQLNITTLTSLSKLFVKDMLDAKYGRIVNVASMAAFLAGPYMAVYYASKAYVLSFTEALANELKGTGVSATVICPGPTKTKFMDSAGAEGSLLFKGKLSPVMESEDVAKIGYRGIMNRKRLVTVGFLNTISNFSMRFSPRAFNTQIGRILNKK
jgi:short-subunit dehydrogenase